MCIYYTNREKLSYTSEEHIFPASIGGIKKLPKGFVCHEFNNALSKLELKWARKSMVSIARELEGPGKRGKTSPKHATKSEILLLEDPSKDGKFALGYVQLGKVYEITHLAYNTTTFYGEFSSSKKGSQGKNSLFKEKCASPDLKRLRIILKDNLPNNLFLFGVAVGIENNYDYFFVKNPVNEIIPTVDLIKKIGEGLDIQQEPESRPYKPTVMKNFQFSLEDLRIYGKMAFNYLALRKGIEYVLDPRFDNVRNWISYGGTNPFLLGNGGYDPFKQMNIPLPDSHHSIAIYNIAEEGLWAQVTIYSKMCVQIKLCDKVEDSFQAEWLISDWKNKKEYTLFEYLALVVSRTPDFGE